MTDRRIVRDLVEVDTLLHHAVQRCGRALRNLDQERGGYASSTPGAGSPGAGKGSRAEVTIADGADPVDPDGVAVPVTSVESQALGFAGVDEAAVDLERLIAASVRLCYHLRQACEISGVDPGPDVEVDRADPRSTQRRLVLGVARARRLGHDAGKMTGRRQAHAELINARRDAEVAWHVTQTWGYEPGRPVVPKAVAELLAVDLTEQWCTSHLRVGAKRERDRGELCQWCRKFEAVEGFLPPVALVELHVDHGRVYDHQIAPHRQAHRDRQRGKAVES